ncbi:T9SS type A sorting domain-containing protein [Psychroflexus sediminis]|uniref:Por secretion system C-terminal sorting domain-containing protein n=1 Tax=Psychroflexus sediminis TaxID=470826 RepID=A0A1G7XXI5_9FLAO|nr:T9SS type A sorting domain-containing protein [Psychroflexus sediminis]SDG88885.1 Por secretion system C-terminal sorting domain-containing protein [Psychroflexus sediminis]
MKKITFILSLFVTSLMVSQTSVFINEIHYDNAGADVDEGIEIAGPAGTDLTGWSIETYNGSNSESYGSNALSGVIPDQDNGYGTLSFPISSLQNGSPDGLALVNDSGVVIQFLSYEGTITAVDGPAVGLTSEDIGVEEPASTTVGESLQLTGTGTEYEDFAWINPSSASFGQVNANQSFDVALSNKSFDDSKFNLYPNPVTNGILNINTSGTSVLEVKLFNMLGQQVFTSKVVNPIDVSDLSPGVYLAKIDLGSSSLTKKLIIK